MKKFLTLPQEKQDKMVTAAMTLFGEVGYKKAYVSEIAAATGVSKALIFHYFGNKKALYSYLVYLTGKVALTEEQDKRDTLGKDFFERVIISLKFRLEMKHRYPAMNSFIESVYNENDPEVASDVEKLLSIATDVHAKLELMPNEKAQFKDGVDPQLVVSLLEKYSNGVVSDFDNTSTVDSIIEGAKESVLILKNNLCKN